MTRLLLVRHGETSWNVERRFQGHSDVPLNQRGRQQAEAVAARLDGEPFDAIYASPLARAWETAQKIAESHSIGINREPHLMEMKFGEWEGLTFSEIQKTFPESSSNWMEFMIEEGAPGGENLRQFSRRIQKYVESIIQSGDENVLIVTHSGVIKVMLCLLLDHPVERYWQFGCDRTSISEVSIYPDGAILSRLNDTSHLIGVEP